MFMYKDRRVNTILAELIEGLRLTLAHTFLNCPKGVQLDSNPAIWKAMVAH